MCLSDTHGTLPQLDLDGIDLVLHAGDWSNRQKTDYGGQLYDFTYIILTWIEQVRLKVPFYWTLGNHETFVEDLPLSKVFYDGMINNGLLLDDYVIFNGLKIWGNPWTPTFCNWGFNDRDYPDFLGRRFSRIPDDTDIIISHGPIYGIHDFVDYPADHHAGSKELARRVKEIRPKLVLSGHLHDDRNYGWLKKDGTTFVGCSLADEMYQFTRQPIVVEI